MAELIGLRLQGVRSIGDQPHIIQFASPLTIIQGPNGTGKTTIIEALNYVTTGALPAGKMQSFIHNNRLANRSRVDALVQLKFRDVKGNVCTATKRMCASTNAKGGKTTTKSDEYTLMIADKFGNEKSLSSKVADFNKEMLNLLGVPKAILEHVIFCHQEESNWPLSEPKELKVRFDAIFEVTKYVKALDNIKKNMKELEIQLRLIDNELPHLESHRQAKANLHLSMEESRAQMDNNRLAIESYKAEKAKIDERIAELSKDVQMASKAKHQKDILTSQLQMKRQFLGSICVANFEGSRDELVDSLINLRKESETARALAEERRVFLRETERQVRAAEAQLKNSNALVSKAELQMNQMMNTITVKQKDLERHNAIIDESLVDPSRVDEELAELRANLQEVRAELGLVDGRALLYKKWETECTRTRCCPLCERRFVKTNEVDAFGAKMRENCENLPAKTRALQATVQRAEEDERRLLKVQPLIALVHGIEREELPKARRAHQVACEEFRNAAKKRDANDAELGRLRDNLAGVNESQVDSQTQDNQLRLMEDQLKRMDFDREVEELEAQLAQSEWRGRDPEELLQENTTLSQKAATLNNRIQQKLGEQSQIEAKLKDIKRELANPRYADAKSQYLKKVVERAVVTAAIQDLSKFWKVLDDSIINFHQHKMEQINHILQDLWARVYAGNDIETIKIKSQPVSSSEKKKSYDYSVVMTVDQMDIDMRDHCSAGQKMLASILIRIALADVFAGNCPVLALDEPTTNLDVDKVENIAEMLKSLLECRTNSPADGQSTPVDTSLFPDRSTLAPTGDKAPARLSLQLLVITHDERLVQHLYLACRPEYIYVLRKDSNGSSHCTKRSHMGGEMTEGDY